MARQWLHIWMAVLVSSASLVDVAEAQNLPPPAPGTETTDQLRARLERVEKLLEELLKEKQAAQAGGARLSAPVSEAGEAPAQDQVKALVEQYLQSKEKQRAAADASKKNQFVEIGSDLSFKGTWRPGTWRDGLYFETPNKDFNFHMGGRMHWDMGWFSTSSDQAMPIYNDAMGFRRLRLRGDGTIWETVNFVQEVDFANPDGTADKAVFTDAYLEATQLPILGFFRAGNFKEPFCLDELIGDNDVPFLERSLIDQAFAPARHLGVMAMNTDLCDGRASLAVGMFRNSSLGDKSFDSGDGEYAETIRATLLPYWANDGRGVVEVGGAYSHRSYNNSDGPNPSFSSRTSLRLGTPFLLTTGESGLFKTSGAVDLWGAEAAMVLGPLYLQGEVIAAQVENNEAKAQKNGALNPNPLYWGTYLQASYFLTGEHHPWNKTRAVFGVPQPHEKFFLVRGEDNKIQFGRGAWELTARWDYLDLRSEGFVNPADPKTSVGGTGVLQDVVLGVNWYWNANARWQLNYVRAWRDSDTKGKSGTVDGLGVRFILYF